MLPARGVCAWSGAARPGEYHSVVPAGPVLLRVCVRLGPDQGAQGPFGCNTPTRLLRLRGGSGAPLGWPPPQQQQQQQPPPQTPGGEGGRPQEFLGFQHGFVDNGVSYAEQFAAQLRERRRMGM